MDYTQFSEKNIRVYYEHAWKISRKKVYIMLHALDEI